MSLPSRVLMVAQTVSWLIALAVHRCSWLLLALLGLLLVLSGVSSGAITLVARDADFDVAPYPVIEGAPVTGATAALPVRPQRPP